MDRIGRYEVEEELGSGGFGAVYRAWDPTMRRHVAIKVLFAGADRNMLGRFRNEAATNIPHKNIITPFDFGEFDRQPYLVMELLVGKTLQKLIHESLLYKVGVLLQIAEGLEHAHRQGVIHRDIKPANIMVLTDGVVKILDFGIARFVDQSARFTPSGNVLGTLPYMAPELLQGAEPASATDVFSYGVTGYELLTGVNPFRAKTLEAEMFRLMNVEPEPLHALLPDCPDTLALEQVVHKALAKDPSARYADFPELLLDLAPIESHLRAERAAELCAASEILIACGDFDAGQDRLNAVFALERANVKGQALRKEIQWRREYGAAMQLGEAELADKSYDAAIHSFERALGILPRDSADEIRQTQGRLETAKAERQAAQRVARLLNQAHEAESKGDLNAACGLVAEAAQAAPWNREAASLLQTLEERLRQEWLRREKERLEEEQAKLTEDAPKRDRERAQRLEECHEIVSAVRVDETGLPIEQTDTVGTPGLHSDSRAEANLLFANRHGMDEPTVESLARPELLTTSEEKSHTVPLEDRSESTSIARTGRVGGDDSISGGRILGEYSPGQAVSEEQALSFSTSTVNGTEDGKAIQPLTRINQSDQCFASADVRIGIVGGESVGKRYLFQAMLLRIIEAVSLHRYVKNRNRPHLWRLFTSGKAEPVSTVHYLQDYLDWRPLRRTAVEQSWYRVRLTFSTGLLGSSGDMDVDFVDNSGAAWETGLAAPKIREVCEGAFKEATTMVFCLPLWVLFPRDDLTDAEREYRESRLTGFGKLVAAYREIRNQALKVQTVLALTMADDERSALGRVRQHWIEPCINAAAAEKYRNALKRPWGVPRYLACARETSEYLYRELDSVKDDRLTKNICKNLEFGHGRPRLIPMSAVDGADLEMMNSKWIAWQEGEGKRSTRPRLSFCPVPAHVELPLLAAIVEHKLFDKWKSLWLPSLLAPVESSIVAPDWTDREQRAVAELGAVCSRYPSKGVLGRRMTEDGLATLVSQAEAERQAEVELIANKVRGLVSRSDLRKATAELREARRRYPDEPRWAPLQADIDDRRFGLQPMAGGIRGAASPAHTLGIGEDYYRSVAFSPDGKVLAASGDNGGRLWNTVTWETPRYLNPDRHRHMHGRIPEAPIAAQLWGFSPDSKLLIYLVHSRIGIFDVASAELLFELDSRGPVAFSPDGKLLSACSNKVLERASIKIWNTTKWEVARSLTHGGDLNCVAFSPDGKVLASAGELDSARVQLPSSFTPGTYSEECGLVDRVHGIVLWNPITGERLRTFAAHLANINCLAFSPDGELLASCSVDSGDSTIIFWDHLTGTRSSKLLTHSDVRFFRFSPHGKLLASMGRVYVKGPDDEICRGSSEARIWNWVNGELLRVLPDVQDFAFSPDGSLLATCCSEKIEIWPIR
jgi:tetratricopeptide (TPR) repeat protein